MCLGYVVVSSLEHHLLLHLSGCRVCWVGGDMSVPHDPTYAAARTATVWRGGLWMGWSKVAAHHSSWLAWLAHSELLGLERHSQSELAYLVCGLERRCVC